MKPPLPADRPLGFARAAKERINGALLRCEERYPQSGAHSVLYVVVDGPAPEWRPHLTELHAEYFGDVDPLAPVRLEVVDRATDEALQRLIEAGLVARTTRASRPLFAAGEETSGPTPLTDAERSEAATHRAQAARRLKLARVLGDTGFFEESRSALLEAAHALGRALAVENRFPLPVSLDHALTAPLSHLWGDALPVVRGFAGEATTAWGPVAQALGQRLG